MRHAIIKNGVVENIIIVNPDQAHLFSAIPITDDMQIDIGWIVDGEQFKKPEIPVERLAEIARQQRDQLLFQSDVVVLPDRWAQMSEEQKLSWSNYRQALRDLPKQENFPSEIMWPDIPTNNSTS